MDLRVATKNFERWVGQQTGLVRGDLHYKHEAIRDNPFCFLRATYYRWAQQFPELDSLIVKAPTVLAVGDLHLENFGTWRDALGRLAWGINDFDEAYPLPYTHDLVRLATSALLAIELDHLQLGFKLACRSIMEGYRDSIEAGGRPFVIGEEHRWFKPILQNPGRDPGRFWDKLRACPRERTPLPPAARALIENALPARDLDFELHHRIAGLGNLGKPRFTAIAQWLGGPISREVKALTLSAAAWAQSATDGLALSLSKGPYYCKILSGAIRSPDPCLKVEGPWIVRRLSPDCRRIELAALSRVHDEEWLLYAMGFETANVHLGTPGAASAIAKHLADFSPGELRKSATAMSEALEKDFRRWRKGD